MAQQILQINFNFNLSSDDYKQAVNGIAEKFAALPGLQWKIWLYNEESKEAGGIYQFADKAAVEAFMQSELFLGSATNPYFTNFSVKQFGTLVDTGVITRAPRYLEQSIEKVF